MVRQHFQNRLRLVARNYIIDAVENKVANGRQGNDG